MKSTFQVEKYSQIVLFHEEKKDLLKNERHFSTFVKDLVDFRKALHSRSYSKFKAFMLPMAKEMKIKLT